ncbi:hypothetical protein NMG60_11025234 [Bertholletia excelsa]
MEEGRKTQSDDKSGSQPEEGKTEFQWHIPENIIVLILSKLPVDSLLRCRCVSKSWRSLISDLSVQTQKAILLNYVSPTEVQQQWTITSIDNEGSIKDLQSPPLPFSRKDPPYIWGSCNELVLVSPSLSSYMFLWNPSTGYCKKTSLRLPTIHIPPVSGLCHDPSTGDYKVVLASERRWEVNIMVGSVKSKSWTEMSDRHIPGNKVNYLLQGPTVNGVLHWVAVTEKGENIVCFHPRLNEFTKLPTPSRKAFRRNPIFGLGVLEGSLAMVLRMGEGSSKGKFEVLSMKECDNGGSWTKLFVISSPLGNILRLEPLICTKKGEVMLLQDSNKILSCTPEDGSCREIFASPSLVFQVAMLADSFVAPPNY